MQKTNFHPQLMQYTQINSKLIKDFKNIVPKLLSLQKKTQETIFGILGLEAFSEIEHTKHELLKKKTCSIGLSKMKKLLLLKALL